MDQAAGSAGGATPAKVYAVVDRDTESLLRAVPDVEVVVAARSAHHLLEVERLPDDAGALVISDRVRDNVATLAAALARWAPYVPVVLLASSGERLLDIHAEYLAAAASDPRCDPRARVRVVQGRLDPDRLAQALRRHLHPSAVTTRSNAPPTDSDFARDRYAALRRPGAVTVLVHGCAGGTGTTTVALLLAGGIARRRPELRICVIDVGAAHGEHPSDADVDELVARGPAFLPELGVNVLTVETIGTARLVKALHRRFDVVVADVAAAAAPDPGLVGAADVVLLVVAPLVTSLRGLERRARTLAECPAPDARWGGVVVNGARNGVGFDDPGRVIAAAQGAPIVAAVPYADRDVTIAINAGRVDRLLDHPDLGPVVARLAERCVPRPVEQPPAPVRARGTRRRLVRRAAPAGVPSPFVLDRRDDFTAG